MTAVWLPAEQWLPAAPPIISLPGQRSAAKLEAVICQFGVLTHVRYQPVPVKPAVLATPTTPAKPAVPGKTYCNTLKWDVSRAMSCEIPYWVDKDGNPTVPGRGVELNINAGIDWLLQHGPRFSWAVVNEKTAREASRRGEMAIATWKNPKGHGHVGILKPPRPGDRLDITWMAQAGGRNFEHGSLPQGFGTLGPLIFFAHL